MKRLKGFTLVEVLISIMIVAILSGVIFMTYRTIFDISVRVENEKTVSNEMLFAHQVIQNLADNYAIDFAKYGYTIPNAGVVNELYLISRGTESQYQGSYTISLNTSGAIEMDKDGNRIPLTDANRVVVSGLQFQIIPYNLTGYTTGNIPIGGLYFPQTSDIYHPSFWMRGMMYIKNYRTNNYIRSVRQPIQSFFNIRAY